MLKTLIQTQVDPNLCNNINFLCSKPGRVYSTSRSPVIIQVYFRPFSQASPSLQTCFLLLMLLSGICLVLTSAKPPVGVCFSYIVFVLSCPGCCPCCSQCSAEDRALYRPHRQARLSVLLRARPQWGVPLLKLIELSLFSKVAGTNSLRFFLYLLSLLLPSLHAWFSVFILFYFIF